MGVTDRFGGPGAWDRHCAREAAAVAMLKRTNPGCGTCSSSIRCPDCRAVYCTGEEDWVDEFNPPCDYEGYERRSY